jgi:hypothetical protein
MDDYTTIVKQIEEHDGFRVGQRVRFKQPNTDKTAHHILSMGVDSDGDVWVKLDDEKMPFFDWRDLLEDATIPQEIDADAIGAAMRSMTTHDLYELGKSIQTALSGDSNDDEHDLLVSIAQALGIEYIAAE